MASEWRRADAVLTGPVRVGRIDTYTGFYGETFYEAIDAARRAGEGEK